MRIIKRPRLREFAARHPKTARYLEDWRQVVRAATWRHLADVRQTFPAADMVRVASGRQVIVFNVCGSEFRLIAAVHFDRQRAFILRLLTHAEYSKEKWKTEL